MMHSLKRGNTRGSKGDESSENCRVRYVFCRMY